MPRTHAAQSVLLITLAGSLLAPGCARRQAPPPAVTTAPQLDQPTEPVRVVVAPPTRATTAERAATAELRGDQAAQDGDLNRALAEFERAIATNPELATAYVKAGRIYELRGDNQAAAARFGRAAELDPLNFEAHFKHGVTLEALERSEEAVRAYLRALAVRPDDALANRNLAGVYLKRDEPQLAEPYALRAVRLAPNSGEARMNLAASYTALGRFDEAVVEYQQAAELVPEPGETLLINLADALGRVERYAEMAATLEQLVRTQPSAIAYERQGSALFRLKRYDESLDAFLAGTQTDPEHYPAFNGVAVCMLNRYLWTNKADRESLVGAVDALRTSLRLEPEQPKILELLRRYGRQAAGG